MGKRLIYVEDAIKALHDEIVRRRIDEYTNDDGALDEFDTEAILRRLPSAQPERKTGRWIYDGDCYICSECRSAYGWWADSQVSNFCQNCGADMREGEERD